MVVSGCHGFSLPLQHKLTAARHRPLDASSAAGPWTAELDADVCANVLMQDSIDRGVFLRRQGDPHSGLRLSAVLNVALDVAMGMAYLHKRGILHGGDCSQPTACCEGQSGPPHV